MPRKPCGSLEDRGHHNNGKIFAIKGYLTAIKPHPLHYKSNEFSRFPGPRAIRLAIRLLINRRRGEFEPRKERTSAWYAWSQAGWVG